MFGLFLKTLTRDEDEEKEEEKGELEDEEDDEEMHSASSTETDTVIVPRHEDDEIVPVVEATANHPPVTTHTAPTPAPLQPIPTTTSSSSPLPTHTASQTTHTLTTPPTTAITPLLPYIAHHNPTPLHPFTPINEMGPANPTDRVKFLEAEIENLRKAVATKHEELEIEKGTVAKLTNLLFDFQSEQSLVLSQLQREFDPNIHEQPESSNRLELELLHKVQQSLDEKEHELDIVQSQFQASETSRLQLEAEVTRLNATLRSTLDRMKDNRLIDRQLVNSLLVTYVSKPERRQEVLAIMSKILDWDDHTKDQVGLISHSRWGWLWSSASPKAPSNISDMWISFLLDAAEKSEGNILEGHEAHPTETADTISR
eukprot:c8851_g1_i1.p1 GENE.c8851_g1_i1~~c8851_g1_i1.p1  ORF type:complete len:371 (+),score=132.02 c8851_g1_i1:23-1135(+)